MPVAGASNLPTDPATSAAAAAIPGSGPALPGPTKIQAIPAGSAAPMTVAAHRSIDAKIPGAALEGVARSGTKGADDTATESSASTGSALSPPLQISSTATQASLQPTSATAVDLALAEGSDASGAAASTAQAAAAASGTVVAGIQSPVVQGAASAPASASSTTQTSNAALALSDVSTLSNAGDADKHAHGGAGDAALGGTGGDGTSAAQQLSSTMQSLGSTDAAPVPTLKVSAPVDGADFPQGLADRVSFMVDSNLNGAKLQVNPPQLGPIELQIEVQGNHAQVWMSTHSAVTREALESSLPKLREMLGAQGFGQVSVDISQRSFHDRSAYAQPYERTPATERAAAPVASVVNQTPRTSQGALDAYA
jgi:flagellar hook-length control protein FliK